MVLVTQFNRFDLPLIILASVVLSLVGVLWGLVITGTAFGVMMTGLGVISLAGVVVNNAIVLLDYARIASGADAWLRWLPTSYVPSPLNGDTSFARFFVNMASGHIDARFAFGSGGLWVPLVWCAGAVVLAAAVLRRRSIP